ncbi:MAG: PD40 domain-containing protein [Bacteroidales bacterium]|nr:PD40 domain-containing protein [Bacteroidales bacterium]
MKTRNLILSIAIGGIFAFSACTNSAKENTNAEQKDTLTVVAKAETQELPVKMIPNSPEGAEAYFSPDDKSMIFNGKTGDDEAHMVYTINIDGTNLLKINDKGADACSYYHPDGQSLIWTSTRDNLDMKKGNYSDPKDYPQGAELYTSDLDGSNVKRLTNNKYYDAEVGYSPDGTKILFGRQVDTKMDLWIMDADGSNEKQITFTDDWQEGGAFIMPDNETIIYRAWKQEDEGKRSKDMHIFTIKTDGSEFKQITHESGTHWAPYPSPDGKYFAYVKILPPHNFEVFIRNLETGEEQQMTYNESFDGFPVISHDGKTLSFSSGRDANGERKLYMYLMDISSLNL